MEEDNIPIPEDASELEFLEQEAKEKIFIESEDLPINEDVLKQQVGARQMGFGDDELEIIEGTAFKEVMDDMDAKGIHYSDVDIYSYIPESERLSPYLIFMEDVRNRWYTDEFVNYLVKVSASGAFETIGYNDLPFSPAAQIHEHALNISFRRGPNTFNNMLSNVILDVNNEMGGLNPRKMKIKYINNIFPGGSYKATLEEENRRFWEEKGMTPEGEWLPEVAEQGIIRMVDADGNVTYENLKGDKIPLDDPRLEKYQFDDITEKMKAEEFNNAEGPEKWKMLRDENIITEYEYQELLKGNDPFTVESDTPTNVVDDGIELYHSRAKGVDLPATDKGLHAGTYNAALDKAAMQYNNINFYNWAFDAQEKIAIAHNNGIDIVADMIQVELEDLTEGNFVPIEHQEEVYIEWVTGEETEYIIYFEGEISLEDGEYINDLKANLYTGDMDGFRGDLILELDTDYQYADVEKIANNPDIAKISKTDSKLLRPGIDTQYSTNSLDIAEDLLENIGTGYSFSGERGYDLYKVSIKPNAKILELPGEIVLQINGSDVTWTADELQNTLIDTDSSQVTEIENIKIGDKTIEIPNEARRKDVSKLLFGDYDVITYKNQGEDVGSTSYLFKDSNSYTIEKIDNVKFNDDVNKKFYGTNKYDYYSDKANEFKDQSTFKKYQVKEYNPNLTFTDTPTNVVDNVDELPSLETRFKIETIDPDDYASPGDKYDLVTGWEDDVITPNKVFNPDAMTRLVTPEGKPHSGLDDPGKYVWNDTTQFKPSEMYQRILSGTATDEDITKFFIYLVTHSPAPAYTFAPFNKPDALADIIKIGIFSQILLRKRSYTAQKLKF